MIIRDNYVHQTGIFEDRIYFTQPKDSWENECWDDKQPIQDNKLGNSVRSYGETWGWILEKLGFAVKLHLDGQNYYVNTNSLTRYVFTKEKFCNELDYQATANRLHNLYVTEYHYGFSSKEYYHDACVGSFDSRLIETHMKNGEFRIEIYRWKERRESIRSQLTAQNNRDGFVDLNLESAVRGRVF